MKKFLSFLLTFVMLFSLAMPAMAAEVTGSTNGDVTASYTPTPVTYTVTVSTSENGTVTASPAEAVEGTMVTLTVTPAEGYELDQLTIKDDSDNEVTWEEGYTFTMPAANVTVTATFTEVVVPTYDINIAESIENGTVVPDKNEAKKDDIVTLLITPTEGYELDSLIVDDTDVTAQVQDSKYTFTMGEAAVEVKATFKKINYTITIDSAIVNGTITAPTNATIGDTVALTVRADAKYELATLTVTREDTGAEVTVTDKTFTMPAANVTVTATFKTLPITSISITWGSMSFVYDDTIVEGANEETGWTCAEGANLVTVTNGDESAITASVKYKQQNGYEAINGYFAENSVTASADLDLNASHAFALTLSGKPEDAIIAGTKIGSVIVTIDEYEARMLNLSFVSTEARTYKNHTVRFYDAAGNLIHETEKNTSATASVEAPSNAAQFAVYAMWSFSSYPTMVPNFEETVRLDIPSGTSNVVVTMTGISPSIVLT